MRSFMTTMFIVFFFFSDFSFAESGGSVALVEGRLKIQFSIQKENSRGSYQLRSILEQHGFKNQNGFVRTKEALNPLEMYNYLYSDGKFVFTIFLPVDDEKFFVSFDKWGFVSFEGIAAQRLFDIVKLYVPRNELDNLEQYQWADHAYCDKTITGPVKYRCWFDK